MSANEIRGHLEMLILATLARGPAHGYALARQLHDRSGGHFDVPEGSLYPALHRLEASGCVESSWDTDTGRRRRLYSVTGDGKEVLRDRITAWRRLRSNIDEIVGAEL